VAVNLAPCRPRCRRSGSSQASSTWAAEPASIDRVAPIGMESRRPTGRSAAETQMRWSPWRRKSWALSLTGKIPRNDAEARLGWLVIIGSLPIVVLGLIFQDAIDHGLRNLWTTAAMLAGFGIIIGVIDQIAANARPMESMTWRHGLFLGLVQSLALIPGVSRSGATIAGGLALGYQRVAAAKFSFLLAIPAVVGSGLFKLADISADPIRPAWGPIALATLISFVIGYAVIAWLLRYVSTHTFLPFVIYRIALAGLVALLLITGVLTPLPPTLAG